jgi:hypothetical protein
MSEHVEPLLPNDHHTAEIRRVDARRGDSAKARWIRALAQLAQRRGGFHVFEWGGANRIK